MKKLFLASVFSLAGIVSLSAQSLYTYSDDPSHAGGVILNGIVTKYILANDSKFSWYGSNMNSYTPAVPVVNAMEAAKDNYQLVIFGGTWCSDTQFILPKFFKLQEQSGFPDKSISFFAVDRSKHTIGNIDAAFRITHVPTIIVMKDGKEVGRVVEYGKTGKWDQELAALLK